MAKYRVLIGIDWYGGKRAEPGDIRGDIPKGSISWLLEQGVIEPYDPKAEKATTTAEAATDTPAAVAGDGDTTVVVPENAESGAADAGGGA